MELNGKVAMVTGGAGGLGKCIAENLLESGVSVVLFDLNKERGKEIKGILESEHGAGRVHFVSGSVTKKEDIEAAFKEAVDRFSRIDIMINNAGIMDDDVWEAEIEINVRGLVLGTHEALKYMSKENGGQGGVIVNIASILGMVPFELTPVYTATKHAVIGFTRAYGFPHLFEKSGVRFFAVCPGFTNTDLVTKGSFGKLMQSFMAKVPKEKKNPPQNPEIVGAAFPQLIREASNGSIWVVEGGKSAYEVSIPHYNTLKVSGEKH